MLSVKFKVTFSLIKVIVLSKETPRLVWRAVEKEEIDRWGGQAINFYKIQANKNVDEREKSSKSVEKNDKIAKNNALLSSLQTR